MTGYTSDEVVEQYTPTLFIDNEGIQKCRQEFKDEFGLTLQSDFDVIREYADLGKLNKMDCLFRKKDDSKNLALLTITPIKDKNKEVTGYLGVAMDANEIKRMEVQLKEALQKEIKLGEMKSRFVSMASHEFRTPLSTILSSISLLAKYTTTEDQYKRDKHIDRIKSSVKTLTDILNEFLSLGKIEEGKVEVKSELFDISEFINSITNEMNVLLKPGQEIKYEHFGNICTYTDSILLKHVLINLVSNAIKFSPENANITITCKVDNENTTIKITDQGMGIPMADQIHLFERFFRATNATNIQGTGLGLHIVGRYIEILSGSIAYESELEKGSTFKIVLPSIKKNDLD